MGPTTMNCAHSPIAITIATPAKTVVAVSVELVSVASRTASRPMANSALVGRVHAVAHVREAARCGDAPRAGRPRSGRGHAWRLSAARPC